MFAFSLTDMINITAFQPEPGAKVHGIPYILTLYKFWSLAAFLLSLFLPLCHGYLAGACVIFQVCNHNILPFSWYEEEDRLT
jgi:hypothetical protein